MEKKTRKRVLAAMFAGAVICLGIAFFTCRGTEALVRKRGPKYEAETQSWLAAVKELGGNGIWLVVRGYHLGDDLVAIATNSPLSHAVVLDLDHEKVIEAIGKGVIESPLSTFLHESHRLRIIRPAGWTPARGAAAVAKARTALGKGYDYFGIVGAPSSNHFYCSELAAWSWGIEVDRGGPNHVLHPRQMQKYGEILFDSDQRDAKPDWPSPDGATEQ